jgi:hypothetical protein
LPRSGCFRVSESSPHSSLGDEPGVPRPGSFLCELLEFYSYAGLAGVTSLGGIDVFIVARAGAGARQAFRSKTTKPTATTVATTPKSRLACAKSDPVGHNPPMVMVPWVACDTSVMSTLPPVWLKIYEYQNVTATDPRR